MSPLVYVFAVVFSIFLFVILIGKRKTGRVAGDMAKIKRLEQTLRRRGKNVSSFDLETKQNLVRLDDMLRGGVKLVESKKMRDFIAKHGIHYQLSALEGKLVFNDNKSGKYFDVENNEIRDYRT